MSDDESTENEQKPERYEIDGVLLGFGVNESGQPIAVIQCTNPIPSDGTFCSCEIELPLPFDTHTGRNPEEFIDLYAECPRCTERLECQAVIPFVPLTGGELGQLTGEDEDDQADEDGEQDGGSPGVQ